jgi:hypothetical protein
MSKSMLVAVALGALALFAVPGALADRAYTDPAGDSGAAPDLSAIRVAHDAAGTYTFTVTTNQAVLEPEGVISVYIDADGNSSTGLSFRGLGAEHLFSHDGEFGTGFLWTVEGNNIIIEFTSTLRTSYANGVLTATINRSDLVIRDSFRFFVEAERYDGDSSTVDPADYAPDGTPFYEYSSVGLALTAGQPKAAAKPVAGKRFVVSMPVTRNDGQPFSGGSVTCKARAGATALRPVGAVRNGSAQCAMRLPAQAKRKQLRGSITVAVEGAAPVTKPFSFRVG